MSNVKFSGADHRVRWNCWCTPGVITFLGFAFSGAKIRWSDKAFARFKQRLKKLTGRSWGVSIEFRFAKLAEYLRGWMGYFGISELYAPIPEIDHWLRRRVRY